MRRHHSALDWAGSLLFMNACHGVGVTQTARTFSPLKPAATGLIRSGALIDPCHVTHSKVPKVRTGAFLRTIVLPTGSELSKLLTGKGVRGLLKGTAVWYFMP